MSGDRTASELSAAHRWLDDSEDGAPPTLGLALCWSLAEPGRIGEVALVPEGPALVLGRGDDATARFARIRPGDRRPGGPLDGRLLSRRQLELRADGAGLGLRNLGSCKLIVGGVAVDEARAQVGDVIELERQLVLLVVRRSGTGSNVAPIDDPVPFGRADATGIVGESEAAWDLRARLRFLARRAEPVLVLGESGTGKELAARGLHALSSRKDGPFVGRNAATLPDGLVDAELFGNARNYPNPGLAERPGLIGAADGGTLFLDEIGEMPAAAQAHLLRVLDAGGEYQRLGEARTRRADLRFVAATNRDPTELKHDLVARMPLRLELPGLADRIEDVPLLIRHLLTDAARDPVLAERYFDGADARIAPELIVALLRHDWTHHVRELTALLWRSVETSPGRALVLTPAVRERLTVAPVQPAGPLDRDAVQAALDACGGNVTDAAKRLGLSSRFALYRAMKKLGV